MYSFGFRDCLKHTFCKQKKPNGNSEAARQKNIMFFWGRCPQDLVLLFHVFFTRFVFLSFEIIFGGKQSVVLGVSFKAGYSRVKRVHF